MLRLRSWHTRESNALQGQRVQARIVERRREANQSGWGIGERELAQK